MSRRHFRADQIVDFKVLDETNGLRRGEAVDAPVDAPRGVEVAQAVQALVFGGAMLIDDTGGDLRRMEAALDDRIAMIDPVGDCGADVSRGPFIFLENNPIQSSFGCASCAPRQGEIGFAFQL